MSAAIICVDDEWDVLKSLGNQLKRNFGKDYDIELASSGAEALSLCAELTTEGIDIPLIISDQQMQGMDGDALLIQLHTLYPQTIKIMLTGQADADAVGNLVNAAALYRYIRKPWDEADLILTITEALRRFAQEQQIAQQNASLITINEKLESSLALLLATLEATADGILVLNQAGKIVIFNQRFTKIWNLPSLPIPGQQKLLDVILKALIEPDAIAFQTLLRQEHTEQQNCLRLKNNNIIEYYLQPQQLAGKIIGRVWSFRDVTQEKQAEALVKHQAAHDALTDLPNRSLFNQKLAEALSDVVNHSGNLVVMFLDLDRFKEVNDTFGHKVGDLLLQEVVQRFTVCLRNTDVLARWGGDEFVLLAPQIKRQEEAIALAQRLIEVVQPTFYIEGNYLNVSTSVGIAMYPDDGLDANTLLQNADAAMYQAKKRGRNNFSITTLAN